MAELFPVKERFSFQWVDYRYSPRTRRTVWDYEGNKEEMSVLNPAPNEVDNFQAVTLVEIGLQPQFARNDAEIQFNRHPISFQAHLRDQSSQGEWPIVSLVFAVNLKFHYKDCPKASCFRQSLSSIALDCLVARLELGQRRSEFVPWLTENHASTFFSRNLRVVVRPLYSAWTNTADSASADSSTSNLISPVPLVSLTAWE